MNIFTIAPKASQLYGYDTDIPEYDAVKSFYKSELEKLLAKNEKIQSFHGGLLGSDMIFAEICADMRDKGADIFTYMFIPYINHDMLWDNKNKLRFKNIVMRMNSVRINKQPYSAIVMQERNNWFLERSQLCLAVYNTSSAAKTEAMRVIKECLRKKIPIRCFNPVNGNIYDYTGVKTVSIKANPVNIN